MPSPIESDIHQQARAIHFRQIAPMELRIALGAHVRDVQIADAALGEVVNPAAIGGNPLAIAGLGVVAEGPDRDDPGLLLTLPGDAELHVHSRLVDQLLGRAQIPPQASPVDVQEAVSHAQARAGPPERRVLIRVPGIPLHHPDDPVAFGRRVILEVGPQQAQGVVRVPRVVSPDFVGVRGSQLSLDLPEEVGELGPGPNPFQEGQVLTRDLAPVHPGHVLAPELVSHQPPGLAVHLLPLPARQHRRSNQTRVPRPPGSRSEVWVVPRLPRTG